MSIHAKVFDFSEKLRKINFAGRPAYFNAQDLNKEFEVLHKFIEEGISTLLGARCTSEITLNSFTLPDPQVPLPGMKNYHINYNISAGDFYYKGVKFTIDEIIEGTFSGSSEDWTSGDYPRTAPPVIYFVLKAVLNTVTFSENPSLCGIIADEYPNQVPSCSVEQFDTVEIVVCGDKEEAEAVEDKLAYLGILYPNLSDDGSIVYEALQFFKNLGQNKIWDGGDYYHSREIITMGSILEDLSLILKQYDENFVYLMSHPVAFLNSESSFLEPYKYVTHSITMEADAEEKSYLSFDSVAKIFVLNANNNVLSVRGFYYEETTQFPLNTEIIVIFTSLGTGSLLKQAIPSSINGIIINHDVPVSNGDIVTFRRTDLTTGVISWSVVSMFNKNIFDANLIDYNWLNSNIWVKPELNTGYTHGTFEFKYRFNRLGQLELKGTFACDPLLAEDSIVCEINVPSTVYVYDNGQKLILFFHGGNGTCKAAELTVKSFPNILELKSLGDQIGWYDDALNCFDTVVPSDANK
jgi:hypothetical protein